MTRSKRRKNRWDAVPK